jgi:hypothetical protein
MIGRSSRIWLGGSTLLLAVCLAARAFAEDEAAPAAGAANERNLGEINKQLTNPVSSVWSITFQQNNFKLDPGNGRAQRWSSNLLFQPVLPKLVKGYLAKPSEMGFGS